jgi:hypothetical protein
MAGEENTAATSMNGKDMAVSPAIQGKVSAVRLLLNKRTPLIPLRWP